MEEHWRATSPRLKFLSKTPLFYCISIFFFSAFALLTTHFHTTIPCSVFRCPLAAKAVSHLQDLENGSGKFKIKTNTDEIMLGEAKRGVSMFLGGARRILSGPGSSPPRCTWKCGHCTPCKPVHVLVPPGTPVTTEYYPEAWRCKCGNRLYMP